MGALLLVNPYVQVSRIRLSQRRFIQRCTQGSGDRSQASQTEVVDGSIKRLACRGTVGSLTATPQVVIDSIHNQGVHRAKGLPRLTVAEVVRPPRRPSVELPNHRNDGLRAALGTCELPYRLACLGHGLTAGEDHEGIRVANDLGFRPLGRSGRCMEGTFEPVKVYIRESR
ncbi:MAG: hypothetical protein RIS70_3247 [Planctomycetota bacterium]